MAKSGRKTVIRRRPGRPTIQRPAGERIESNGLTQAQNEWLRAGWQKRGFASATHWLRYIVDEVIAKVEAGEDVTFAPRIVVSDFKPEKE